MGYNSDIKYKEGSVYKTLGKHLGLSNGASLMCAKRLKSDIIRYEGELKKLKIKHPTIFEIKLLRVKNDGYNVFVREQIIQGTTLDRYFSDINVTDAECVSVAKNILLIYQKIIKSGRKIALDPPLSNFILSIDDRNIYYVDLMPPRQQMRSRLVLEYPGPKAKFLQEYNYLRHFTDYQHQSIYVQFCKYRIHLRRKFQYLFSSIYSENILNYISTPNDLHQICNILKSSKIISVDFLRNIALELWYQGKITKNEFDQVYLETHIMEGSGQIPDNDKMDRVSNFIMNSIQK